MSKEKNKKLKHHLGVNIVVICAVFSILLSIAVGTVGFVIYYQSTMDRFKAYINTLLRVTLTEVDGDDVENYISHAEEKDGSVVDNYKADQFFLDDIKTASDIEYIYIVEPLNTEAADNMKYVLSGNTQDDYEKGNIVYAGKLTGTEYEPDVAKVYLDHMQKDSQSVYYYANESAFGLMYTGMIQIKNSAGKNVAILAIDIKIEEIRSFMKTYIIFEGLGLLLLVGIFLVLEYIWMKKRIVGNIMRVQIAAEDFVESSHGVTDPEALVFRDPQVKTGDEIQALSDSFVSMSDDMKKYMVNLINETKDKERIGAELSVATQIQEDMLPNIFPAFPERKEFDLFALMHPAKEVGGDFYDFYWLDDNRLAFVVADVSGKGVPAAMFMVIAKIIMKNIMQMGKSVNETMALTNDQLCDGNKEGFFVTAWLGVLDVNTGIVEYANAGHNPPLILSEGKAKWVECEPGLVLGAMDGMSYDKFTLQLKKNDRILLYTDGVPESINTKTEAYGEERMVEMIEQTGVKSVQESVRTIKKDIEDFAGEEEQFDDITMLMLQYTGR